MSYWSGNVLGYVPPEADFTVSLEDAQYLQVPSPPPLIPVASVESIETPQANQTPATIDSILGSQAQKGDGLHRRLGLQVQRTRIAHDKTGKFRLGRRVPTQGTLRRQKLKAAYRPTQLANEETNLTQQVSASVRSVREVARCISRTPAAEIEAESLTEQDPSMVLNDFFGFESFRPLQFDVVQRVMSQRSTLLVMPTAAGKSLCFQLPALLLDRLVLVISPLLSLMHDQQHSLASHGIAASVLASDSSPAELKLTAERLSSGELRLLYTTPECFSSASFGEIITSLPPALRPVRVAVDEAHCVSEWGLSFRPAYLGLVRRIRTLLQLDTTRHIVALTATATPRVARDICRLLEMGDPADVVVRMVSSRSNLHYAIIRSADCMADAVRALASGGALCRARKAICYCPTRVETEILAEELQHRGRSSVAAYHAGMSAMARSRVVQRFMAGELSVVCATVAFGLGVDIPDIDAVIHVGFPRSVHAYAQETGRAGRNPALTAHCVAFYSENDYRRQRTLALFDGADDDVVQTILGRIASLLPADSTGSVQVLVDPQAIASGLPISPDDVALITQSAVIQSGIGSIAAPDAPLELAVTVSYAPEQVQLQGDSLLTALTELHREAEKLTPTIVKSTRKKGKKTFTIARLDGKDSGALTGGRVLVSIPALIERSGRRGQTLEQILSALQMYVDLQMLDIRTRRTDGILLEFPSVAEAHRLLDGSDAAAQAAASRRQAGAAQTDVMWRICEHVQGCITGGSTPWAEQSCAISRSVSTVLTTGRLPPDVATVQLPAFDQPPEAPGLVTELALRLRESGSEIGIPASVAGILTGYAPIAAVGSAWRQSPFWGRLQRSDPMWLCELARSLGL